MKPFADLTAAQRALARDALTDALALHIVEQAETTDTDRINTLEQRICRIDAYLDQLKEIG